MDTHIYTLGENRFEIHLHATPVGVSDVGYTATLYRVVWTDMVEKIETDGEEFDSGSPQRTLDRAQKWLEQQFGRGRTSKSASIFSQPRQWVRAMSSIAASTAWAMPVGESTRSPSSPRERIEFPTR